jgi:hypothetical protein
MAHVRNSYTPSSYRYALTKNCLEVELLCSCTLTSTVVQGNAMKLTKNLMRCVHLEGKLTMMEYKGHYVNVHSMSCLMV